MNEGKKESRGGRKPTGRPPGAPKGNLNAMRHPAAVYWKRGALRPEDEWIRPVLQRTGRRLVSAKGDTTEPEEEVIDIYLRAKGGTLLVEDERRKTGTIDRHAHVKYLSLQLSALKLLGLDRRAVDITPPLENIRRSLQAPSNEESPE